MEIANTQKNLLFVCGGRGEVYTLNLKLSTTLTCLYILIGLSPGKKLHPPSHNTKDNLHIKLLMANQMNAHIGVTLLGRLTAVYLA